MYHLFFIDYKTNPQLKLADLHRSPRVYTESEIKTQGRITSDCLVDNNNVCTCAVYHEKWAMDEQPSKSIVIIKIKDDKF